MASLNDTGAQLGRDIGGGDDVNLRLCAEDGYTRTFAGDGYRRVNPGEVEGGNADDPAAPANSLNAWNGYDHDRVAAGSDLEAAGGYGEADVDWVKPAGYDRAPALMNQRIYVKDTGETSLNATALATNPFDTPDQTQSAGDGASDTVDLGAYEGNVVAIGVKAEFDDSVDVHESLGYPAKAGEDALTGAGAGIALLVRSSVPVINSITQLTDPASCLAGCTGCVTIRLSVTMEGPSQGTLRVSTNGGSTWSTVDSAVAAGATQIDLTVDAGVSLDYDLAYNDVSPTQRSASQSITTECTLV